MSKKKYLCEGDCHFCEAMENRQLALLLNILCLRFGKEVLQITNQVCSNLTCCPDCRIDDFCHDMKHDPITNINDMANGAGSICEIARRAKNFINKYRTPEDRFITLCKSQIENEFSGHVVKGSYSGDSETIYYIRIYDVDNDKTKEFQEKAFRIVDEVQKCFEDPNSDFYNLELSVIPFVVSHKVTAEFYQQNLRKKK